MKILNAKCLIGNTSFFIPFKKQKTVFHILPGFYHRTDQIYLTFKKPLGDPKIILLSIVMYPAYMYMKLFHFVDMYMCVQDLDHGDSDRI